MPAKPKKIREDYACPHCNRTIVVWLKKGQTYEQQWQFHRSHCRALRAVGQDPVCIHLGEATDLSYKCGGCGGGERTLFKCQIHGFTLPYITESQKLRFEITEVQCCIGCSDREEAAFIESPIAKAEAKRQAESVDSSPPVPVNKASNTRMGPYG